MFGEAPYETPSEQSKTDFLSSTEDLGLDKLFGEAPYETVQETVQEVTEPTDSISSSTSSSASSISEASVASQRSGISWTQQVPHQNHDFAVFENRQTLQDIITNLYNNEGFRNMGQAVGFRVQAQDALNYLSAGTPQHEGATVADFNVTTTTMVWYLESIDKLIHGTVPGFTADQAQQILDDLNNGVIDDFPLSAVPEVPQCPTLNTDSNTNANTNANTNT